MDFRDDLLAILSGGLPALLDGGRPAAPQTIPVEAIPPEPQLVDREPAFLQGVSRTQILGVTAAIVALIGVLAFTGR